MVDGEASSSFGVNNKVTVDRSVAVGINNQVIEGGWLSGASNAFGKDTKITSALASALGHQNLVPGVGGSAFGYRKHALADDRVEFGSRTTQGGDRCRPFGRVTERRGVV